jgi:hypothetical protein
MEGKIGLEEHFAVNETLMDSKGFMPEDFWIELRSRLLDIHEKRLGLMDRYGIERMILSLNAPAVQAIPDVRRAIEVARIANDVLRGFQVWPLFQCRIPKPRVRNSLDV